MFDQRCVNTVSGRFWLLLFLRFVFRIQLANIFFRLRVCECPLALWQLNFWSLVSTVRVLFRWKHFLYLNSCFATRNSISVRYFALRFFVRRDCVHKSFDLTIHVKLQKTSETSKSFWALKAIYSLVQCNPLLKHRTIFHHGICSHVLGNEKVHPYHVPSRKKTSPILREINSNFKELAIFPRRIKGIDSQKFSRIAEAILEPKIGHVTVTRVCYRWWPDKPRIVWRYKIDMMLFTYTVCLHLEQAFETVLKEMKLDIDVLEETFAL